MFNSLRQSLRCRLSSATIPPRRTFGSSPTRYSQSPKQHTSHAQFYSDLLPGMIPVALLGSAVYMVRSPIPFNAVFSRSMIEENPRKVKYKKLYVRSCVCFRRRACNFSSRAYPTKSTSMKRWCASKSSRRNSLPCAQQVGRQEASSLILLRRQHRMGGLGDLVG